jgi:menaquinone-dependent protoporphyrinogen IX oxidase
MLRGGILQKILIIYSKEGDIKDIAEGIAEGAKENGYQVELKDTEIDGRPVSFFPYDLVIAGAPTQGIFRGKIPSDLSSFLKECKRTGGQDAMAFVTPRFFATNKALKLVMGELEKLGCIVKDFRKIKNRKEAVRFGKTIKL